MLGLWLLACSAQAQERPRDVLADPSAEGVEDDVEEEPELYEGEALIRFTSDRPRATLYVVDDAERWLALGGVPFSAYDPVCTAPCDAILDVGPQQLAFGEGGRNPAAPVSIDIREGGALRLVHADNSGTRLAGWLMLGLGLAVSAGLAVFASFVEDEVLAVTSGTVSAILATDATTVGCFFAGYGDRTALRFSGP